MQVTRSIKKLFPPELELEPDQRCNLVRKMCKDFRKCLQKEFNEPKPVNSVAVSAATERREERAAGSNSLPANVREAKEKRKKGERR